MKSIVVSPEKVNLSERDIEDWLYENPESVDSLLGRVNEWIARQYKLPSGIADLIGVSDLGIVVVEIKNVEINKAAITQVCRYATDVEEIVNNLDECPRWAGGEPRVCRALVGPSIDSQTFAEARACNVAVNKFSVSFNLFSNQLIWTKEYRADRKSLIAELADGDEWSRFGKISEYDETEELPMYLDEVNETTDEIVSDYDNGQDGSQTRDRHEHS